MFRLNVLQNQWLILALAGGFTIVLWLVLYYLAMWHERPDAVAQALKGPSEQRRRWFPPALLVFIYVFILVWSVVCTVMMIRNPPNW